MWSKERSKSEEVRDGKGSKMFQMLENRTLQMEVSKY